MARKHDTKEQNQKCLSCKRPKCNNCVETCKGSINETEFLRLYNLGHSDSEIAQVLNVPRKNITSFRWRRELEPNKGGGIDKVVVVRCKDCAHWQRYTQIKTDCGRCKNYSAEKHENGFCDKGERKSNE